MASDPGLPSQRALATGIAGRPACAQIRRPHSGPSAHFPEAASGSGSAKKSAARARSIRCNRARLTRSRKARVASSTSRIGPGARAVTSGTKLAIRGSPFSHSGSLVNGTYQGHSQKRQISARTEAQVSTALRPTGLMAPTPVIASIGATFVAIMPPSPCAPPPAGLGASDGRKGMYFASSSRCDVRRDRGSQCPERAALPGPVGLRPNRW